MKIVESKKFVCTSGTNNNNKYWGYKLYDNDDVIVEWGRIGKSVGNKTHCGAGEKFVKKKIKEKIKKGYQEIDIIQENTTVATTQVDNLKEIAKRQIQYKDPTVGNLITYLVSVNRHIIKVASGGQITWNEDQDIFQTPLGIVSIGNITKARDLLQQIAIIVKTRKYELSKLQPLVENYLFLIPQDIGMKFNIRSIFPNEQSVIKQNALLDALESSYKTIITQPKKDNQIVEQDEPKVFNMQLDKIEDQKTLQFIKDKFLKTRNSNHVSNRYSPKVVYQVAMPDHEVKFQEALQKIGNDNIWDLWHGTQASNVLSILKGGLVIPPSNAGHVTGRMFGNGLYFSDQSTKALNYAVGYWGGGRHNRFFMFLAKVNMGKLYVPSGPSQRLPAKGYDSTFAKGSYKSGVMNNEMIVYKTSQASLRYLVEFE